VRQILWNITTTTTSLHKPCAFSPIQMTWYDTWHWN
jgi:hypothetical protein